MTQADSKEITKMLFDFTTEPSLDGWNECSDVVRSVGMSKAVLALQQTQLFQRAVFFTMLNSQPNGAGFAGVNKPVSWNLQDYNTLQIEARGQGDNYGYKIILRHKGQNHEPYPTYEQFFHAPKDEFRKVELPFSDFKPYYRGRQLNDSEPLDLARISSIGIQVYGGVYLSVKQKGTSSLEINWVRVLKKL